MEDTMAVLKEMIELDNDIIPNIYVNDAVLNTINGECDYKRRKIFKGKVYEINGSPFEDMHTDAEEEYVEFEIEENKEPPQQKGKVFWENAVGEFGTNNIDSPLVALTIQETHSGVIVNSNVFLLEENWHTVVNVDDDNLFCVVCSMICTDDYPQHINSEEHRNSLKAHLPLDYYDLSIIRKIDGEYHCGVCNLVITAPQLDLHLSSKPHEEKLLTAINRVSDILDVNSSPDSCLSIHSQEDDFSEGFYDFPNSSPTTHNGYLVDTDSDDDQGPTYASIAGTPSKTPKYIEIEMGVRKVWVQTDTWHMILTHKPNKFYCMVCRIESPMRKKSEHCTKTQHLDNLAKCKMVKKYKHHLVRKVDNIFLHCGHCNNLRLLSDIEGHLELRHPITKNKNIIDSQKTTKTTNGVNGSPKTSKATVTEQNKTTRSNIEPNQTKPTISNVPTVIVQTPINPANIRNEPIMVELYVFNTRMVLPVLNFNMVVIGNGLHCCLCEQTFNMEAVQRHLAERYHIEKLKQTHFIPNYSCNLIRVIRDGVHCGICNVPLPYNLVFTHINQYTHMALLNNAIMASLLPPMPIHIPHTQSSNQFSILNEVSDKTDTPIETKIDKDSTKQNAAKEVETESILDRKEPFDLEDFILVKVDKITVKMSVCSYNTLVALGDGTRHCFLCSETLSIDQLEEHVRRRDHQENLEKNKFMDKRKTSLIRQQYVTYHCGVCNVLLLTRELNSHLTWHLHIDNENSAIPNKKEKKKIKDKIIHEVSFQKEFIYTDAADPKIQITKGFKFTKEAVKKYKMVIFKGSVARIEWNAWHSLCKFGDGFKCCLCQKTFDSDLVGHTKNPEHIKATENFLKMYLPALIRMTNEDKLHCVTCNMELKKQDSVFVHMYSKSHKKIYKSILKSTSVAESYQDCSPDVFSLDDN